MENYEKLAIDQVVYELAAQRLCSSKEVKDLYDFDDYCNWLAYLTNSHGGNKRKNYAYALYALNMWSHEIKEVEFKLEAQLVMYQLIKSPCVRIVVASINLLNKQGAVSNQQCITKGIQANLKKQY